jgi:4-amino-4-deoxy-L-arabinose transferase-like glycosyltransferase
LHLLGLALLLAITLPWPLYILRNIPNVDDIWYYESVGKVADELEPGRPFYFYLPSLFQLALPWTPVWLLACALPFLKRRHPRRPCAFILHLSSFPALWLAALVIAFSFAHMKKLAYLLPVMPAFALMTAQGLVFLTASVRRARRRNDPAGLLLAAQTFIPLGFAVALLILIPKTELSLATRITAAVIPAALALLALRQLARRRPADWLLLTSIPTVLCLVAFFNFVQTPKENARSPRPAAAYMDLMLRAEPGRVTAIPAKLPPEATLYLPADLAFDPRATTLLYLLDDRRDEAAVDLAAFAARLPDHNLSAVRRLPIPGTPAKSRYKLFALTTTPGQPKALAAAPSGAP